MCYPKFSRPELNCFKPMTEDFEVSQGKSIGDLGREAVWFAVHTILAILTLLGIVVVMWMFHPNPDAIAPKLLATALALLVPMVVGFLVTKLTSHDIGRYVWISGLLIFAIVCVWVIDLPTGPGLCEHCTLMERLWRTFFDFQHGSGLMGGDGVLIGTWIPLSLFGYAIGAKGALGTE
jgi:hypothetical protein